MTKPPVDLKNFQKKLIVITGHMGSGKSTIGKIIAKNLNWNYFDSDKEIEKKQKEPIKRIFQIYGEDYFREKEEMIIKYLIKKKYSVISLGGGSVTIENIINILQKNAISIFLKVDIDVLVKRLKNNKNRPLLNNSNIKNKIDLLDIERLPLYNKADIVIENSKNISQTVFEIMNILNK